MFKKLEAALDQLYDVRMKVKQIQKALRANQRGVVDRLLSELLAML